MPLRAYIDNEEIISIDQTDEQWNILRKRLKSKESILLLPCCKQEGFLRKSSKGLKHFVHSKSDNTCDWKPESPEHLKAKIEIIQACKENGWQAIPEFAEINWRADVLAIRGDKRIAFEVQWSKQTFEETENRQNKYKEFNVRGCWFFRKVPPKSYRRDESILTNKDIPAFRISKDDNSNIVAQFDGLQLPLKSLVDSLLKRKLKFCEHITLKPKQDVTITFFETSCWKCKKPQHLYTIEQNLLSVCNQHFYLMGSSWDSDDIDKNPQVYEAVRLFMKTESGKHLKIGELKERYSNTVQKSYLSHGCFYCGIIFGDHYTNTEKLEAQYLHNNITHTVEIDLGLVQEEKPHWCYSEDGHFCE